MCGGAETAAGADAIPVGGHLPDAECGEQRHAGPVAHGQRAVSAGDHGRHRRSARAQGRGHVCRTDRQDGHADEYARLLYALLSRAGAGDAADPRNGPDVQQGLPGSHDTGYAGAAGAGRHQEPLFRQHDLEEELSGRPRDDHRREQPGEPCQPTDQGAAVRRGGPLPGQRRNRGRPAAPGAEAPNDLLGQEDRYRIDTDHQGKQPHRDGVPGDDAGGMERTVPEVRALSAPSLGQHRIRPARPEKRRAPQV